MKVEEFEALFDTMLQEERQILFTKGQDYSGREDCLGNFKRLALQLGMTPERVLWVYLVKHLDSILSYINGTYGGSEPIIGRIYDARNYLALLAGLIVDKGDAIIEIPNKGGE